MEEATARSLDPSDALRARLGSRAISDLETGTIVVLPSITFPEEELRKITAIEFYAERMLYALLWLRHPEMRIVYITSSPVDPAVVDYYLGFVDEPTARERLTLVSLDDSDAAAISGKLLSRPELIEQIRSVVGDDDAYILPFNVTSLEVQVSHRLEMPLYGARPDHVWWGSKSGARSLARDAGVAVPRGQEDLRSVEEVELAVRRLRDREPRPAAAVIKLNNGFSGQGNAIVELGHIAAPFTGTPIVFCCDDEGWDTYGPKIALEGAVVEELIRAPGAASPSAQFRIAPNGEFEAISTHDQILGGPELQVYLGCRFPAGADYRLEIQELGLSVAEVLASQGVIGPFGIDYIVRPTGDGWDILLTEINLRMGGTSHPFFMARFVTEGSYDPSTGNLVADGRAKHYVANDNLKSEAYVGLAPATVIDAVQRAGIAFDVSRKTGVTLHLMGALRDYGKFGGLAIGDSADEADALYLRLVEVLDSLRS
ncbi:MAG: hypothetical protein GEU78_04115 [Actinobacteria bacterium]|nr:hypothetical protein [Actinomycetota bacterium]